MSYVGCHHYVCFFFSLLNSFFISPVHDYFVVRTFFPNQEKAVYPVEQCNEIWQRISLRQKNTHLSSCQCYCWEIVIFVFIYIFVSILHLFLMLLVYFNFLLNPYSSAYVGLHMISLDKLFSAVIYRNLISLLKFPTFISTYLQFLACPFKYLGSCFLRHFDFFI